MRNRYYDLRKELSSLNYPSNFGIDALDIVSQLFSDLVSTNKSYAQVYEKEQQLTQEISLAQSQLFPLRKENAKLVRENQQLHLENIKVVEESTQKIDKVEFECRRLNDRVKEVSFVWYVYLHCYVSVLYLSSVSTNI
jgi:centrosomal protein CEP135